MEEKRINICPKCEKVLTVALAHAFKKGGYKVDLEYCFTHKPL